MKGVENKNFLMHSKTFCSIGNTFQYKKLIFFFKILVWKSVILLCFVWLLHRTFLCMFHFLKVS